MTEVQSKYTCFLDGNRLCLGCAACLQHDEDGMRCMLLDFAGAFVRNQTAQTEVLQGVKKVQEQVVPLLEKVTPFITRMMEMGEKAMPAMEKMMNQAIREINDHLDEPDGDGDKDE